MSVIDLIGNTPLIALEFPEMGKRILVKCEFLNPSGSIKDRIARYIVLGALESGELKSDSIIVECSSGNTGIAMAMVGAAVGLGVKIVMSEQASIERRKIIEAFGGEVVLFTEDPGMMDYWKGVEITKQMAAEDPRVFLPRQFENPDNALDHEMFTGQEILRQVPVPIDAFVAGYGTGGTLMGVGRALRKANPKTRIVAMEPAEAALLSGEMPCLHSIEGIGDGFIPPLMDIKSIDDTIRVSSSDALEMTQRLMHQYGLPVGTSSGANVVAALRMLDNLPPNAVVVSVLCDRSERYFSTRLFSASDCFRPRQTEHLAAA
ncbi:MAG TPA: cysteine synthase family protein [Armatimonadota bacterium]|jgi:cysteine synthase A